MSRGKMLKAIMGWLVTDGQTLAESVKYVPLPPNIQRAAVTTINKMQV
jgi:hypothetical protein